MTEHDFDPGYGSEPFRSLAADYPGTDVYPSADFRSEWGPIFHRGRLDGSSRILVIGQDPATHETIARRILIGTAGHRVQGFLAKLGIDRSYTMINTYLYSVYGQSGGEHHKQDPKIAAYRARWFDALLASSPIEAVVALGGLADTAWTLYLAGSTAGVAKAKGLVYAHVPHPTYPESGSGGVAAKKKQLTTQMLAAWNTALIPLHAALEHPDAKRALVPYGEAFVPAELPEIPAFDLPAGSPDWMRGVDGWATRTGDTPDAKRRTLTVHVPKAVVLPSVG
ncbi:MAG TPA: uracil-DNA glycosylase family protein [Polyangiaceae bacterium]|jgi:hypothetical protein